MSKKLCPTCYTELGKWLDDPILTPKGFSGDEYKGLTKIKVQHIIELQNRCKEEEILNDIYPKTNFSPINNKVGVTYKHIEEIRWSIERILFFKVEAAGADGRAILLEKYFNYDAEGTYMGTFQKEWVDPELDNKTKIRAIHIEDLRHPIPASEFIPKYPGIEFNQRIITTELTNVYSSLINGGTEVGFKVDFSIDFKWNGVGSVGSGYCSPKNAKFIDLGHLIQPFASFYPPWIEITDCSRKAVSVQITSEGQSMPPVGQMVETDGKYLYIFETPGPCFIHDIDCPQEVFEEEPIRVSWLSDSNIVEVCEKDEEGKPVSCRWIEPIDSEEGYTSWHSYYIAYAEKVAIYEDEYDEEGNRIKHEFKGWRTSFTLFPYRDSFLEAVPPGTTFYWLDSKFNFWAEHIYPAPGGYNCMKIGNGIPDMYEEYYNEWWKSKCEEKDIEYIKKEFDYIGHQVVEKRWGPTGEDGKPQYYRRFNHCYYEEFSLDPAPIEALFEKNGKQLTYTCNVS